VKFAHDAGLEPHGDAGDALGDRQLRDGRLLAEAAAITFPADFSSANLNVGSWSPDRSPSGTLFMKLGSPAAAGVAAASPAAAMPMPAMRTSRRSTSTMACPPDCDRVRLIIITLLMVD
jgi:hypothetical protein